MRVALVTREYPPETAWGGIGKFYGVFSDALTAAGHEVEVFTQGINKDETITSNGITVHRIIPRKWILGPAIGGDLAGYEVSRIGMFALSLADAMRRRLFARHRLQAFDIVEGHEHLGINSLINLFGRHAFVTVTRYHTAYHTLVSRKFANWPVSKLITRLEGMSLRKADARIAASKYIETMTREDFRGVPPSDAVLPLFPDEWAQAHAPGIREREKLMLFVGRMMPGHKNPDMAAAAFAMLADRFPDWRIEFAGLDIPLEDGRTGWQLCEDKLKGYEGRYHYYGPIPPEQVQELYRRARIALMPSGFESFGLVALECLAAGTVPIVSDSTALPEIVGDAGVVFRNGSPDDLRDKLAGLMSDENRQVVLSEAGVRRVAGEFSREKILHKNLDMFQTLVNSRRSKRD